MLRAATCHVYPLPIFSFGLSILYICFDLPSFSPVVQTQRGCLGRPHVTKGVLAQGRGYIDLMVASRDTVDWHDFRIFFHLRRPHNPPLLREHIGFNKGRQPNGLAGTSVCKSSRLNDPVSGAFFVFQSPPK